jgi:hypothetical protein
VLNNLNKILPYNKDFLICAVKIVPIIPEYLLEIDINSTAAPATTIATTTSFSNLTTMSVADSSQSTNSKFIYLLMKLLLLFTFSWFLK